MPKYLDYFKKSWTKLEERYYKGECNPKQENDIVCYIYHELLNLFGKDIKPSKIKTEYFLKDIGRVDMNVDNKLFIEFMKIERKKYIGKEKIQIKKKVYRLAKKLSYTIKKAGRSYNRLPVIALWVCSGNKNIGISNKVKKELELWERELWEKNKVRFIFGPSAR